MKKHSTPGRLEWVVSYFVIYMATSAHIPPLPVPSGYSGEDSLGLIRLASYLLAIGLVVCYYRTVLHAASRSVLVPCIVLLTVASSYWSPFPLHTAEEAAKLAVYSFFGIYLSSRFGLEKMLVLLTAVIAGVNIASFSYILLPGLNGVDSLGAWKGAFVHKNTLGIYSALAIILSVNLYLNASKRRLLILLLLLSSSVLLLQSDSKTPLICLITVLICVPLIRFVGWGSGAAGLALLLGALATPVAVASYYDASATVLSSLGRDTTFTGRTEVWEVVLEAIRERPLLGYGYRAFWFGDFGPSHSIVFPSGWRPEEAHNGYLDVWLSVGLLGLTLFLASLVITFYRTYHSLRNGDSASGMFVATVLVFLWAYNVSESAMMLPNFSWLLYAAISTAPQASSGVEGTEKNAFPYQPARLLLSNPERFPSKDEL